MNTRELIEKLKTLPDDTEVRVWNCYHDQETAEVFVSANVNERVVWIMDSTIGIKPL